ncbi:MAG: hypothetical protein M3Y82_10565 [Verrucomicrobiota bacterium]|nr:hypothetical protein [Verrucomicrobiota bacterium]
MGKNSLTLVLIGLLFISALVALLFAFFYLRGTGQLRSLQYQAAQVESRQNFIRALATDTMEYSKHNPAIDPILQNIGLKPRSTNSPSPSK